MLNVDKNVSKKSVLSVLRKLELRTAKDSQLRDYFEECWPRGSRWLADACRQHVGIAHGGRVLAAL